MSHVFDLHWPHSQPALPAGAGLGLQVLQQLGGINTVMYYTPAILELAGVVDKRTALLAALAPAAVNALGTLAGMAAIDRCGRRWQTVFLGMLVLPRW